MATRNKHNTIIDPTHINEIYKKVPLYFLRYQEISELCTKYENFMSEYNNEILSQISLILLEYFMHSYEKFDYSSNHLQYLRSCRDFATIFYNDPKTSSIFGLYEIWDELKVAAADAKKCKIIKRKLLR